jgi:hypothetical protein
MSTISLSQRIKTLNTVNNRNVILIVLSAAAAMLVVISAVSTSPVATPFDFNAYSLYRQGEWLLVPNPADNAKAYEIFRAAEVASPVSNAEAYQLFRAGEVTSPAVLNAEGFLQYRQGEWISVPVPAMDLNAYHLSERTLIDPQTDMAAYHQSERTLIEAETGLAAYLESEKTLIPVRDLSAFNAFQRSEWFGE